MNLVNPDQIYKKKIWTGTKKDIYTRWFDLYTPNQLKKLHSLENIVVPKIWNIPRNEKYPQKQNC